MNLEALCKEAGVKLYDTELTKENGKKIYRIFIYKDGGVNLDDCARLSEILSPIFDVEDPFDEEYFLEISSPGLERKLHTLDHFSKRFLYLFKNRTSSNNFFRIPQYQKSKNLCRMEKLIPCDCKYLKGKRICLIKHFTKPNATKINAFISA